MTRGVGDHSGFDRIGMLHLKPQASAQQAGINRGFPGFTLPTMHVPRMANHDIATDDLTLTRPDT